jgi:DNA gyrase/topoisomerase IV subunit B
VGLGATINHPPARHEQALQPPPRTDIATSVVQTLVLYSLAEHQLGHAKTIRVTASEQSFSVEDDGRGHAIGRSVEGSPYLDFIYCHLDFPYKERKAKPIQLQGLGMSLLNRLCAELVVMVRKPEATLTLRFESGRLVNHELTEATNTATGNRVAGTVCPDLATRPLGQRALERWLEAVLAASPSLQLFFNGQRVERVASGA